MHKYIEEFSLNALPAFYQMSIDGWIARYADGYTKRANSVNPIYNGESNSVERKLLACENFYTSVGLNPVFKMTPFIRPGNLDELLEQRGYEKADLSSVQTLKLDHMDEVQMADVKISAEVDDEWMDVFACFTALPAEHMAIKRKMLSLPFLSKTFMILYKESAPVACVTGMMEQEWLGIYDLATHPGHRGQGYARQLVLKLLQWGIRQGARHSYLQVLKNNAAAMRLYGKLGYREAYTYWYRVQNGKS